MRKSHLISILVLFAAVSFGQAPTKWARFVVPDKSCSVLMPDTAQKQSSTEEKQGVKSSSDLWLAKTNFGVYIIGITDYSVELDPKSELDADRDNFLKAVNAKLVDESDISLSGVKGREFTGISENYTFKCRFFYINKRTYSIMGAEPTKELDVSRVKKFLESFEFGS